MNTVVSQFDPAAKSLRFRSPRGFRRWLGRVAPTMQTSRPQTPSHPRTGSRQPPAPNRPSHHGGNQADRPCDRDHRMSIALARSMTPLSSATSATAADMRAAVLSSCVINGFLRTSWMKPVPYVLPGIELAGNAEPGRNCQLTAHCAPMRDFAANHRFGVKWFEPTWTSEPTGCPLRGCAYAGEYALNSPAQQKPRRLATRQF